MCNQNTASFHEVGYLVKFVPLKIDPKINNEYIKKPYTIGE